jgi:hypothetical protein
MDKQVYSICQAARDCSQTTCKHRKLHKYENYSCARPVKCDHSQLSDIAVICRQLTFVEVMAHKMIYPTT